MNYHSIIGLGNPGERYQKTRHNVGFLTLDLLQKRFDLVWKKPFCRNYKIARSKISDTSILYIQPLTYMNNSGQVLPYLIDRYQLAPEHICIICDNMDLAPGTIRIKQGGGTAGHNGLKSLIGFLGSNAFIRVYIGIGRPLKGQSVVDHVLGVPDAEEMSLLENAIVKAADAVIKLAENPPEKVMNEYNRKGNSG